MSIMDLIDRGPTETVEHGNSTVLENTSIIDPSTAMLSSSASVTMQAPMSSPSLNANSQLGHFPIIPHNMRVLGSSTPGFPQTLWPNTAPIKRAAPQLPTTNPFPPTTAAAVMQPLAMPTHRLVYKCPFSECSRKSWFEGFTTRADLEDHLKMHVCQWTIGCNDGSFTPCRYIPSSHEDAGNHLEWHLSNDVIPKLKYVTFKPRCCLNPHVAHIH